MEPKQLLDTITESISDIKGLDLVVIDINERSSYADYMVVCHGTSSAHVKGITDNVQMTMKKHKILPLGVEGYQEGEWVLLDYNIVVVHIFQESARNSYKLEELFTAVESLNQE